MGVKGEPGRVSAGSDWTWQRAIAAASTPGADATGLAVAMGSNAPGAPSDALRCASRLTAIRPLRLRHLDTHGVVDRVVVPVVEPRLADDPVELAGPGLIGDHDRERH